MFYVLICANSVSSSPPLFYYSSRFSASEWQILNDQTYRTISRQTKQKRKKREEWKWLYQIEMVNSVFLFAIHCEWRNAVNLNSQEIEWKQNDIWLFLFFLAFSFLLILPHLYLCGAESHTLRKKNSHIQTQSIYLIQNLAVRDEACYIHITSIHLLSSSTEQSSWKTVNDTQDFICHFRYESNQENFHTVVPFSSPSKFQGFCGSISKFKWKKSIPSLFIGKNAWKCQRTLILSHFSYRYEQLISQLGMLTM